MQYMIEINITQLSHLEMDKVKDFILEVFGRKNIVEIFLQEIGLDHLILLLLLQELDIIGQREIHICMDRLEHLMQIVHRYILIMAIITLKQDIIIKVVINL